VNKRALAVVAVVGLRRRAVRAERVTGGAGNSAGTELAHGITDRVVCGRRAMNTVSTAGDVCQATSVKDRE
jgi:hypothetical protein